MNKVIFSEKLQAGSKTYFFDIRKTKRGSKYLRISESRLLNNKIRRKSDIAIFNDHFQDFKRIIDKMYNKLME